LNDQDSIIRKIKNGEILESNDTFSQTMKNIENKKSVLHEDPSKLLDEQIKNKVANGVSLCFR